MRSGISCQVDRQPSPIFDESISAFGVASYENQLYVAFSKSSWVTSEPTLSWATFDENATIGKATFLEDSAFHAITSNADGLQIAHGASLTTLKPDQSIAITGFDGTILEIVGLGDELGLLLASPNLESWVFVRIAQDGERTKTMLKQRFRPHLAASGNDVVMAFSDDTGCHFLQIHKDGSLGATSDIRDRPLIEDASCHVSDMITTEEGFLVAVEIGTNTCQTRINLELGNEEPVREQHLELIRLDTLGQRIEEPIALSGATGSVRELSAQFIDLGVDIGLMWSRGSVIYECGGCIGDDILQFTVLSKQDLSPRIETIDMSGPLVAQMSPGTMLRHNNGILVLFQYVIHAINRPGSALIRCE